MFKSFTSTRNYPRFEIHERKSPDGELFFQVIRGKGFSNNLPIGLMPPYSPLAKLLCSRFANVAEAENAICNYEIADHNWKYPRLVKCIY